MRQPRGAPKSNTIWEWEADPQPWTSRPPRAQGRLQHPHEDAPGWQRNFRIGATAPHRRSRRRAGLSPYEPRNPAPGARPTTEAAHRAARGRASTGAPISTSPTKRSWAGAGRHWGRQRAIGVGKLPTPIVGFLPRCESPTPMRVSCPDTARRTRKGPAAGNRSVERTPRTPPPPTGDAPVEGGARRTPRTRAHSPGPLGISARSAASRSGTS